MKKLTLSGMIFTCLLGLALWQQQLFVTKAAPMFATLTVTNTNDSGAGSLRQAIADAVPGDTITFDTVVFATPQTITLTSGQLVIDRNLTIQGPGASQLTVSGNNASRVFFISSGTTVTLDGLTVSGGTGTPDVPLSYSGGGIYSAGTLTVSNSTVSGNYANAGGGISSFPGSLTINNSSVSGNSAGPAGGGGILNGGTLTLTNSTVSGNSLTGNGGGIAAIGPVTLTNSTVSGNSAQNGGAFFCNGGPIVKLINSTVSGNSAAFDGGGFVGQGSLWATNSTFTGNRADSDGNGSGIGGGIKGAPKLNNTIVAGNFRGTGSTPDDISNGYLVNPNSDANNLIGDAASANGLTDGVNGNRVGFAVSAVLNTTLTNNSGPTLTHALVPGSPALNAGSNALAVDAANQPLTTDQRGTGFPRIIGTTVDIGAFEVQAIIPSLTVNSFTAFEGNAGTTTFNFVVSLNSPAGPGGVTFDIATLDNSAMTADNDYMQKSLTGQTIQAGSSTYTFSVTVNGDTNVEPAETFWVVASNVTGATLANPQGGLGNIRNEDFLVPITITTVPTGLDITVDGTSYTSPQTFEWAWDSNHTIATPSPQSLAAGTQAAFLNWSDSGALSHNVTTPAVDTTYTATFKTQHLLMTTASAGGMISPASGFYDAGSNLTITATANAGYSFTGFSSALTGTTNPQSLTLSAPATVNANFAGSTVFNFVGFFQPVDNLPTVNSVNAGQSIPVKFSLTGYQGMAIFAAGFPASQTIACSSGTPDPIEETATAGASSLSYDAATDRYTYVWKTEKAWKGTCRKLIVKFTDGTTKEAHFQFR